MPDAGKTAAPEPLPNYDVADPVAPGYVEAGLDPATLHAPPPGESAVLSKRLRTGHIWAMGVGSVITGEYFGWNGGLGVAGPIGMLIASLFVCVLYMAWVLSLAELSVAMPFAGGPLAYGRRAVGPWLGFLMGWSMLLESLFATIGTAIATGGYVYFILKLLFEKLLIDHLGQTAEPIITTLAGLVTVLLFALLQWWGVQSQAKAMEWMTYGAIVALVWFWIACIPGIDVKRLWTNAATGETSILPFGWRGVLLAIPYAIWWLVIIESVALAAEEAHEPHKTIPRGLAYAQVTLIVLVVATWFVVSSVAKDSSIAGVGNADTVLYPLPIVYQEVWAGSGHLWHLLGFSVLAICGMVASYNGMIFAVSRQTFALGRAGYLPSFLGRVHAGRHTPTSAIVVGTVVVGAFVVWNYFSKDAVTVAVLTCNLTALIWYALAIVCLFILRYREPHMARPYKVPLYPILPAAVLVMSVGSALIYGWSQKPTVLWLTAGMYALGLTYYFGFARSRLTHSAPEEIAARRALEGLSADDAPLPPR